jgi:hypothetical protein
MTPGVDVGGVAAGERAGVPATVTLPAGAEAGCSTGGAGLGAGCAGFVVRFGVGFAAARRAGRRRSLDELESAELEERRPPASETARAESEPAGPRGAVVTGDGARVGAGFGAERHPDTSSTLAKTTSP